MMLPTYLRGRRTARSGSDLQTIGTSRRPARSIAGLPGPFLMASLWLALSISALAQGGRGTDNVLYPQPILPSWVGIDGGYAWWSNSASFGVADGGLPCATFSDGSGSGMTIGARLQHNLTPWIALAPRIRYEARSSSFVGKLPDEPIRDVGGKNGLLKQEAQVDATLGAMSLDLLVAITLPKKIKAYAVAGPSIGLATGGTYNYIERITGPAGFVYSDNGAREHTLAEGRSFENYKKLLISVRAGAGYIYRVGDFGINPEVLYSLPLTSALDTPDELKQSGFMATLGILYYIGE